ncbi:MAG: hypothetical protein HY858_06520 [Candidatus Solibacter usitatus]|nr:hypothetical protein [Candidatus Solibacter usitatus]
MILLLCLMLALESQAGLPREVLLQARIKQKVERLAAQAVDYTCLETIERSARDSAQRPFRPVDVLRLEVGLVGKKEVFSWPGAEKFEERSPADLVSVGTVSTGEFMQLMRAVFIGNTASIKWRGEEELNGRPALRYDYSLPLFGFRWQVALAGGSGEVRAEGSFWADAETLDILRLEARAVDIPPGLPLEAMTSRTDYGMMQMRGAAVWLPQSAELTLRELGGKESRNRIEFSHCRQFSGSSSLLAGEIQAEAGAPAPAEVAPFDVPAGLSLSMTLETEVDSSKARVGDLLEARLTADAVLKKKVIIPKDAVIRGRLRRLERSAEGTPHFVVGVEFAEIEFAGKRGRLFGKLQSVEQVAGLQWMLSSSSHKAERLSGGSTMQGVTVNTSHTENIYVRDLPGVGTFFMTGTQFRLPRGLKMTWQTVELPRRPR